MYEVHESSSHQHRHRMGRGPFGQRCTIVGVGMAPSGKIPHKLCLGLEYIAWDHAKCTTTTFADVSITPSRRLGLRYARLYRIPSIAGEPRIGVDTRVFHQCPGFGYRSRIRAGPRCPLRWYSRVPQIFPQFLGWLQHEMVRGRRGIQGTMGECI